MANFLLILELLGGLIILIALGWLVGHLLKLDKYFEKIQNRNKFKT